MNALAELFGSRTRAGVLATLCGAPATEFHLNELAKKVGVGARAVQQEVVRLLRLGLIRERRSGNRRYFSAERSHPAFEALSELIRISAGARDVLREALVGESRIRLALLYGSVASGTERTESDVDLLVVGDLGLGELLEILSPAQDALRRPINPVLMTAAEFQERRGRREHFIARVLESNPIAIVGSLDDASELAGKPLDSSGPHQQ